MCWLTSWLFGCSNGCLIVKMMGWWVGGLFVRSFEFGMWWFTGRSIDWSMVIFVGWLASRLADWLVCKLICWLVWLFALVDGLTE